MQSIIFSLTFDSKVIDCQAEDDGVGCVMERSQGAFGLSAAGFLQSWDWDVAGDSPCLGESTHASGDFDAQAAIFAHPAQALLCRGNMFITVIVVAASILMLRILLINVTLLLTEVAPHL